MHIVLGATGHVGSAVAEALLERGEPVIAVARDAKKAEPLRQRGAAVELADVHDAEQLRAVFARGRKLFLLNPRGAPSADPEAEEQSSLRAILSALSGSGLQKLVALSTYGAQAGTHIGELGVLYELEQALVGQPIPSRVLRAAYFMSNWDRGLESARREGKLECLFPVDFELPMVAPQDVGQVAAQLMMESAQPYSHRLHHLEGPARYSPRDVAEALGSTLDRAVHVVELPRARWSAALAARGFSSQAALSFAGLTERVLAAPYPEPQAAMRATTTLRAYLEQRARSD